MQSWRVTKYDPAMRDPRGAYTGEDWIDITDIGRVFNGVELTVESYLSMETKYVDAVAAVMSALDVSCLRVCGGLERYSPSSSLYPTLYSDRMLSLHERVADGYAVSPYEVKDLCRLLLRHDLWCKLESPTLCVHFGHDYYMFVVSAEPVDEVMSQIGQTGLFPEPFLSPYLEDPEEEE